MTEFDAVYFDGHTSARSEVHVQAGAGVLRIAGAGVALAVALEQVSVDARVGDAPRSLRLPGGALLQTRDHAVLAVLFPRAHPFEAWVQRLERRWGIALAAIGVVAGAAAWFALYGIPFAAGIVARAVPQELAVKLGDQTLRALDGSLCSASQLEPARRRAIVEQFGRLTAGDAAHYRLELRTCPHIGPNAYALPGGIIVVLDELVKIAADDREVAAVIAHEIGHVHYHHALRLALQGAGVAAVIGVIAGDAVSITSMAVALPTLLLQSSYSREFEAEADSFAFARLTAVGLSPQDFAAIMTRLEEYQAQRAGAAPPDAKGPRALDYLSTHPDTAQRIERARNYR